MRDKRAHPEDERGDGAPGRRDSSRWTQFFSITGAEFRSRGENRNGMRARLLLPAAPALLLLWLASDLTCSSAAVAPPGSQQDAPQVASARVREDPTRTPTAPPELAAAKAAGDSVFVSSVRPILLGRCAPCHEPGGKMYDRLPFDHPEVVASHREGVLRRVKDPDERAAIERWLSRQNPS